MTTPVAGGRPSVIVTGAARGIGAATARRLADDGAAVIAVDRDADPLDAVVGALPGDGHRAWATDLRDLAGHDALVEAALSAADRFLGLAHLAAVLRRRATVEEVSEEDWDLQIDVNLKATFFLNRAVATALVRQGQGGSIVNFTSQAWNTGGFGGAVVYATTKGGVVSMSRGLARTFAPHGVRVNTVAPGFVETEMMLGGLSEQQIEDFRQMVPLGRMAAVEELASTVSFLMGDDARYVTGATLNVTGGQLMY
ncbi:MAG TPA: SDR family NAD(P)-dependent oxidoreductase [Mycobacteriales bacterium]|nr:SDR family NAD(P)-dependent oxidoreductase [Mycobacteriales bacterium]